MATQNERLILKKRLVSYLSRCGQRGAALRDAGRAQLQERVSPAEGGRDTELLDWEAVSDTQGVGDRVSDWPPKIRFVEPRTFVVGTCRWYPVRVNGR